MEAEVGRPVANEKYREKAEERGEGGEGEPENLPGGEAAAARNPGHQQAGQQDPDTRAGRRDAGAARAVRGMKPVGGEGEGADKGAAAADAGEEIGGGERDVVALRRHRRQARRDQCEAGDAQAARAESGRQPGHRDNDGEIAEKVAGAEEALRAVVETEIRGHSRQHHAEGETRQAHRAQHHEHRHAGDDPGVVEAG